MAPTSLPSPMFGKSPLLRAKVSPEKPAGALVLGGGYVGLSITRSLGRHGVPVWILLDSEDVLAAVSRYKERVLPWPHGEPAKQVEFLLELAQRHGLNGWALFPTGDECTAVIARNASQLAQKFCLTTPTWDVMRWAHDKRLTYTLAERAGVDWPRTWYPASYKELEDQPVEFPVVLKPAVHDYDNLFTRAKAWRSDNRQSLQARYAEACALIPSNEIIVQELIPGDGASQFSYAAMSVDGRPLASVTVRRTRQYPLDFGYSSTFVESVIQPEVERAGERTLSALNYSGLAEVEFKHDRRDGKFKLLDINFRLWNWNPLGCVAGVDFPYLLWQWQRNEHVPRINGEIGVKWVRMSTDILSALAAIRKGELSVGMYLRTLRRPMHFALSAADDMLPALLEIPAALYKCVLRIAVRFFRKSRP
jgi:D-aspartate ligase